LHDQIKPVELGQHVEIVESGSRCVRCAQRAVGFVLLQGGSELFRNLRPTAWFKRNCRKKKHRQTSSRAASSFCDMIARSAAAKGAVGAKTRTGCRAPPFLTIRHTTPSRPSMVSHTSPNARECRFGTCSSSNWHNVILKQGRKIKKKNEIISFALSQLWAYIASHRQQ
jgi:hypothetical protein